MCWKDSNSSILRRHPQAIGEWYFSCLSMVQLFGRHHYPWVCDGHCRRRDSDAFQRAASWKDTAPWWQKCTDPNGPPRLRDAGYGILMVSQKPILRTVLNGHHGDSDASKQLQPSKKRSPMSVTESGIVMLPKDLHSLKALNSDFLPKKRIL